MSVPYTTIYNSLYRSAGMTGYKDALPKNLSVKTVDAQEFKMFEATAEYPNGEFSGYASVFKNKDRQGEVVQPGAFSKSLEDFKRHGFVAFNHNWKGLPIGFVIEAKEDEIGLWVRVGFHDHPEAQAVRGILSDRMKAGQGARMSIGYKVLNHTKGHDAVYLNELDLFEVSVVNVPANPLAYVTGSKDEEGADYDGLGIISEVDGDNFIANQLKDLDSSLAEQTFEKQYSTVLAANEALLNRFKSIVNLRVKEGRGISTNNDSRLETIELSLQNLSGLVAEIRATGKPKPKDPADTGLGLTELTTPVLNDDGKGDTTGTETKETPEALAAKEKEEEEARTKEAEAAAERASKVRELQLQLLSDELDNLDF
jgi:HK97 family phage prohead protease